MCRRSEQARSEHSFREKAESCNGGSGGKRGLQKWKEKGKKGEQEPWYIFASSFLRYEPFVWRSYVVRPHPLLSFSFDDTA